MCIAPVNVVGLLLLRVCRILHPFVPAVRGDHAAAVPPYRLEELAAGRSLSPGIDRRRALTFRPDWLPAPGHQVPSQAVLIPVQYPDPRPWRDVVPINGLRIHTTQQRQLQPDGPQVFPR